MQIHKDGSLVGIEPNGWTPRLAVRSQLLVGQCGSSRRVTFSGSIVDVKAWNAEVHWEDLPKVHVNTSRGPVIHDVTESAMSRGPVTHDVTESAKKFRQAAARNDARGMRRMFRDASLLHAADRGGKVALHYAARDGASEAVQQLLHWKADPNIADGNGQQPLDEAEWWHVKRPEKAKEYSDVLGVLQRHDATFSRVYLLERRPILQRWAQEQGLPVPWQEKDELLSRTSGAVPAASVSLSTNPGAPRQVVLNCANIGHTFSAEVLHRKGEFAWDGVRRAIEYYESKGVQVHAVCKASTLHRNPIPEEDQRLQIIKIPSVDVVGKGIDDLYTLRIAQENDCQFVDNDNYRYWKKPQAGVSRELHQWLCANEQRLKVSYIFDADGRFVPQR